VRAIQRAVDAVPVVSLIGDRVGQFQRPVQQHFIAQHHEATQLRAWNVPSAPIK
jgi:hypothetical protein